MNRSIIWMACLAVLCLLPKMSLHAQQSEWKVASVGIHLQYRLPNEPSLDRERVIGHLSQEAQQARVPANEVGRVELPQHVRYRSGLNMRLERQINETQFAQLRVQLDYTSNNDKRLHFGPDDQVLISEQGLGLAVDYRRSFKRGAFHFSAGLGTQGKWYFNPRLTLWEEFSDDSVMVQLTTGGAFGANNPISPNQVFGVRGLRMSDLGPARARLDYGLYLPLAIAVDLTDRIQVELEGRLNAELYHVIGTGIYPRPLGGSFQLTYVFLL